MFAMNKGKILTTQIIGVNRPLGHVQNRLPNGY